MPVRFRPGAPTHMRSHAERLRAAPVARRSPRAARRELRRRSPDNACCSPARTAPARPRCCAPSPACSTPRKGRCSGAARRRARARDEFHSELAYLGHEPPLKGDLSARENLHYSIGIRRAVTAAEIDAALDAHRRRTRSPIAPCACCPRASGAAWRWPVCCSPTPCCGCSTNPPPISMPTGNSWCATSSSEQLARGGIVVAAVHHSLALPAGAAGGRWSWAQS